MPTVNNKAHIQKIGYNCPYRHSQFHWPANFDSKFFLIRDSLVKYLNNCDIVDIYAFPGANIDTIYWKLRLGKIPYKVSDITVLHVGTNYKNQRTRFFPTYRALIDKKTKEVRINLDRLHLNFKGNCLLKKNDILGNIRNLQGKQKR